ncbi:hypothetical protein K9N68_08285 [Kovacikia minuta CCNUW1]|uniref:hypothetical protein n=1 Tax=Kovacikia minuta TaxID=2931930 RepID=UPI001CC9B29C|nr:hypothetical protein [Kovacikia minuta]UBF27883.1 hypothetical protein K9N68_08285 [Kovacikia minuta CCNUW1]
MIGLAESVRTKPTPTGICPILNLMARLPLGSGYSPRKFSNRMAGGRQERRSRFSSAVLQILSPYIAAPFRNLKQELPCPNQEFCQIC